MCAGESNLFRLSVGLSLQECCNRFPNAEPPLLDPIEDMEIEDGELITSFNRLEEVEKLINSHPLSHSSGENSKTSSAELLMVYRLGINGYSQPVLSNNKGKKSACSFPTRVSRRPGNCNLRPPN